MKIQSRCLISGDLVPIRTTKERTSPSSSLPPSLLFFLSLLHETPPVSKAANNFARNTSVSVEEQREAGIPTAFSSSSSSTGRTFDVLCGGHGRPRVADGGPASKSMGKKVGIRVWTRRYDVIQLKKLPLCNPIRRSQPQPTPLFQSKPTPVACFGWKAASN